MDLTYDNIRFVPAAHRRLTFAEHVRRAAREWRPQVIAVELPATLESWIVRGAARLPIISAVCWEDAESPGALHYIPLDPCDAMIEGVRLALAHELDLACIDLDLPGAPEAYCYVPDDLIVDKTSLEEYVAAVTPWVSSAEDDWRARARECHMALRLRELAARRERVLCILGMSHFLRVRELLEQTRIADPYALAPQALRSRGGAFLTRVDPRSLEEVLGEIPYLTYLFELQRAEQELTGLTGFDKLGALQSMLKQAELKYQETYKETITLTQWKGLLQFTRNLAMLRGRLRPDLYELIMGARGMVDGDYGYEVYELARSYPPQADAQDDDVPRLRVRGGRGAVDGRPERFRMQSPWEEEPTETVRLRFRRRPPRAMKEEWKRQWQRGLHLGICSWPPEDKVQEDFMAWVRQRALQVIGEDQKRVREFSTSLLDGLDVRETMRNWHRGKLFVHETPQPRGKVGAVVLIFEDEPLKSATSWRTTLFAEHQNESDISFYATPLGEHVVGPRICRTEFGGIMSIYPAWGIPDIWRFAFNPELHWCSEALLAGSILFSPERYIAYAASRPPADSLKQLAERNHRHVIYLPLHMFSRSHLKRLRRFHILDGHHVRSWAGDYIFED